MVIADSKSPRNGKIISKIGIYNPNIVNNEQKIILPNSNKNLLISWIKKGAQPTKTVKDILNSLNIKY
ncbi:MAG: 30S ribosomal protein S16 [Candidatus Shikimatogenerans sp. JK-2022]|nr:30S ribosomal protein S16 [Candidatus Shikimatogenerans bostrichidophilus]